MTVSGQTINNAHIWRTDLQTHIFAEMQMELYADVFSDAEASSKKQYRTVFAPGCVLSCASSKLTLAVYGWLLQHSLVDGVMFTCCGNILKYIISSDEQDAYRTKLISDLRLRGIECIITACPNCFNEFGELTLVTAGDTACGTAIATYGITSTTADDTTNDDAGGGIAAIKDGEMDESCIAGSPIKFPSEHLIESSVKSSIKVLALSDVLLEHKEKLPCYVSGDKKARVVSSGVRSQLFSIHDSCPDRLQGVFANSVRSLLLEISSKKPVEMEHNKQHSRCCGLGKMLAMRSPDASNMMATERVCEFSKTKADTLITYCATCTQAFQPRQHSSITRTETISSCKHYLELLFGVAIDWRAYEQLLHSKMTQLV